jgi:hypothetical protein
MVSAFREISPCTAPYVAQGRRFVLHRNSMLAGVCDGMHSMIRVNVLSLQGGCRGVRSAAGAKAGTEVGCPLVQDDRRYRGGSECASSSKSALARIACRGAFTGTSHPGSTRQQSCRSKGYCDQQTRLQNARDAGNPAAQRVSTPAYPVSLRSRGATGAVCVIRKSRRFRW